MVRHQLGRRNLTPKEASYFRGERYRMEKRDRRETLAQNRDPFPHSEGTGETAARIAEEHGVSRATVERDADFAEAVDALAEELGPEVRQDQARAAVSYLQSKLGRASEEARAAAEVELRVKRRIGELLPPRATQSEAASLGGKAKAGCRSEARTGTR